MGFMYDVSKIVSEVGVGKKGIDKFNQFSSLMKGPSSITSLAKKSIMSYPVLISEGVIATDENLVNAVCKYLEVHYAIFTMIAMSLDPVLEGTDPKTKLVTFYSSTEGETMEPEAPNCVVSLSTTGEKIVTPEEFYKPYNKSQEDTYSESDLKEKFEKAGDKDKQDDHRDGFKKSGGSNYMAKIVEKTKLSEPTIVNVKFKMASNNSDIEFPVAVKANPSFVSDTEATQIFSYIKEDKPLVNLVKLLSGEISLFKDILFQVDKAKEDKKLYARLGRHPWFRQLLVRKNSFKIWNFIKTIFLNKNEAAKVETNVMPVCSLVVTKDEIERGLDGVWDRIKEKECKNIVDKLMLLSFCVVDTTTRSIEISFYGLKNNTIMRLDNMIKDYSHSTGDKSSKDFEKLLQAIIYKSM